MNELAGRLRCDQVDVGMSEDFSGTPAVLETCGVIFYREADGRLTSSTPQAKKKAT